MSDQKTPLYKEHVRLNGRMVAFAGWLMPIQYTSIIQEHEAVRNIAGLFDVSHMGEITISGKDALVLLEETTCNQIKRIEIGQVQYNVILNKEGGIIDDVTIYKTGESDFFICSNASNYKKVFEHLLALGNNKDVDIADESLNWHQLAIQGPKAESIFQKITKLDTSKIKYFRFVDVDYNRDKIRISRTGYTGEDGFEIYSKVETGVQLWKKLIENGKDDGLLPIGLGARDTLRLEARYPLYGNELNDQLTPVESGIGWIVKDKPNGYFSSKKILDQKKNGCKNKVVGFVLKERAVPRQNMEVQDANQKKIGEVLSGTFSPNLKQGIGTTLIPTKYTEPGTPIYIKIREKLMKAEIHKGAFVNGTAGKK